MKRKTPKIGLDIDGVLADFTLAWHNLFPEFKPRPNEWIPNDKILERFEIMRNNETLDEFFLNLEPLLKPEDIPFIPYCYITSRPVSKEISEQWLSMHGFPSGKVISPGAATSKVNAAKELGIDIFVDDYYKNFIELNNNGIFTYLYSQPWNIAYDVGNFRLDSLKEIPLLK